MVVIKITPFAPLDPNGAVAEASFKTETDAKSFAFKAAKSPAVICMPSTIYIGAELPLMDPLPLIRTLAAAPGCPDPENTCTPGA